ncbi:hypothetical protein ACFOOP_02110 [Marinicaulis aureus]|uniref:Uncharacterized protein n=1 Tax=Hyphococcus aureus TaxID=2666033 RepID=A0ABW1KZP7_9PROT
MSATFNKISRENAAWIKWLALNTELKQQDIALMVGIHPGTVNHVIRRKRMRDVRPVEPPDWIMNQLLAA